MHAVRVLLALCYMASTLSIAGHCPLAHHDGMDGPGVASGHASAGIAHVHAAPSTRAGGEAHAPITDSPLSHAPPASDQGAHAAAPVIDHVAHTAAPAIDYGAHVPPSGPSGSAHHDNAGTPMSADCAMHASCTLPALTSLTGRPSPDAFIARAAVHSTESPHLSPYLLIQTPPPRLLV